MVASEALSIGEYLVNLVGAAPQAATMNTWATAPLGSMEAKGFCSVQLSDSMAPSSMRRLLEFHGVSEPRQDRAAQRLSLSTPALDCYLAAIEDDDYARNRWADSVLKPWCEKYGLTFKQGLQVACIDGQFRSELPEAVRPAVQDIFGPVQAAFARQILACMAFNEQVLRNLESPAPLVLSPKRISAAFGTGRQAVFMACADYEYCEPEGFVVAARWLYEHASGGFLVAQTANTDGSWQDMDCEDQEDLRADLESREVLSMSADQGLEFGVEVCDQAPDWAAEVLAQRERQQHHRPRGG